jgi:hypothetical protein
VKRAKPATARVPMTTLALLRATRDLLSDASRWTKGVGVRSASGGEVMWWYEPEARSWDLGHAMARAGNYGPRESLIADASFNDAEGFLFRAIGLPQEAHLFAWNDAPERTHADILNALDGAIALATEAA